MQWADRSEFGEGVSELAAAADAAKAGGETLIDLTVSNPTRCGFHYDSELLLGALNDWANLSYAAEAFGPRHTRQAIAEQYYGPKGIAVAPERLMLTGSTSEAYGYLFRLLCNPGDEVLVPRPSYPLFDLLAQLHDVRLISYPIERHDGWSLNVRALERLRTERTRAIVLVHPNNPTGHFVSEGDRIHLERFAADAGLALIVDEVFLDYAFGQPQTSFLQHDATALTFVMSGLSKVLALPQMKLAWTAVHGPATLQAEAMRRLEYIADTFLPVSAPVASATAKWLQAAVAIQAQLRARIQANLQVLDALIEQESLLGRLPVEGGWSVVLRVPAAEPDEDTAMRLLRQHRVLVHPGSFYGFPQRGFLVLSLLVPDAAFYSGIEAIAKTIDSVVNPEPAT